jgi:hypothetical protein
MAFSLSSSKTRVAPGFPLQEERLFPIVRHSAIPSYYVVLQFLLANHEEHEEHEEHEAARRQTVAYRKRLILFVGFMSFVVQMKSSTYRKMHSEDD